MAGRNAEIGQPRNPLPTGTLLSTVTIQRQRVTACKCKTGCGGNCSCRERNVHCSSRCHRGTTCSYKADTAALTPAPTSTPAPVDPLERVGSMFEHLQQSIQERNEQLQAQINAMQYQHLQQQRHAMVQPSSSRQAHHSGPYYLPPLSQFCNPQPPPPSDQQTPDQ